MSAFITPDAVEAYATAHTSPAAPEIGKKPSARDIVAQRAYLRAFLDRYVLRRRSPLLDGPSRRFPQVRFAYRAGRR